VESVTDFIERVRKNAESVAGIGYWSWNMVTDAVYWSEQCYRIYGRDPQTWVPTPENYHHDIYEPDQDTVVDLSNSKIVNTEPFSLAYRYYRGGRRDDVRWVQTDCDFITNDEGELSILGVTRDITEQKKVELALEESRNRFEAFADAASDWFWEMDENLRFNYMSPRAETITGVPVPYFIGKTRREVAGEMVNSAKWQAHLDDLEAHRPFRDFRFVRKGHDGHLQFVTTSGIPRFDEAGNFTGYAGASAILSEQLNADEKAHLVREQLAQAVNVLSELFCWLNILNPLFSPLDVIFDLKKALIEPYSVIYWRHYYPS